MLRRHLPFVATAAMAMPALAAAPLAGSQAPGFQRRRVGRFEVTALLDGHLPIEAEMFSLPAAESARLITRDFRPAGPVVTPVNAFALNDGQRLILVDAGTGTLMPGLGGLPGALAAAGLAPAQVDAVLLTHLHPDHAGGLLTAQGGPLFPNAEILVQAEEAAFWTDAGMAARAGADAQPFFQAAQAALAAYGNRVRRFAANAEVAPGIRATALPGHTPGHTGFMIEGGLWLWADTVHVAAFQFPRPEATIAFDTDRAAAAAARGRAFDQAATERLLVGGAHLPFPGFGHVERDGGYIFRPAPFLPL